MGIFFISRDNSEIINDLIDELQRVKTYGKQNFLNICGEKENGRMINGTLIF